MRITITEKIGLALLLPAAGALLAMGVFFGFLVQTASDGSAINIAGQQRMLAHQILYNVHMIRSGISEDRTGLVKRIARFNHNLKVLTHGGRSLGRAIPPAPPEIVAEVAAVSKLWSEYKPVLLQIASRPSNDPRFRQASRRVEGYMQRLTEASDRVVNAYETRNRVLQKRMLWILVTIAILSLVSLAASLWLIRRYVNERKNTEDTLRELAKGVSAGFDEHFFQTVVQHLTHALEVDYALIVKTLANDSRARTLAVSAKGELADDFEYPLAGTPCDNIIHQGTCIYPYGVRERFPEDKLLAEMGIDSYMGTPLYDANGKVLGILAIMDSKPLSNIKAKQSMFKVFAVRIQNELERVNTLEKINALARLPAESPEPVLRVDRDGKLLYANNAGRPLLEIWQYRSSQPPPRNILELVKRVLKSGAMEETQVACGDETFALRFVPVINSGYVNIYGRNITEYLKTNAFMNKLTQAIEQTADAVVITNNKGIIEYVNPAFEDSTGYSKEEALGKSPRILNSGRQDQAFYKKLWATIQSGKAFQGLFVNRKKDGTLFYEEKTITPIKNSQGEITHFVSTGKDVTERMQAQKEIDYLAFYDPLTALPNRTLFHDRFRHALTRARRHNQLDAILFLDLDNFKTINDSLGHAIGDELLQAVAARLKSCVRESDTLARLGGDEFVFILENISHVDNCAHIAQKILDSFRKPFCLNGQDVFTSASIGIAFYPLDDKEIDKLLRAADTAMYRAKGLGGNRYQFYTADMTIAIKEHLAMETKLRYALERHEFQLQYQPKLSLKTGEMVGMEVLLRWQHPELGMVSPMEFIPLLERNGLITTVGEWVLRMACQQNKTWQEKGFPKQRIAVNVSAHQLRQPDFAARVAQILEETGLDPADLELELTESMLMEYSGDTIELLNQLNKIGVHLTIDDFGTGYSSLAYLKRFPIQTLKIDRTFVRDITSDKGDATIAQAVIAMAHKLGMVVVAEGVETEEQLAFLHANQCDEMQGYLFSKPLSGDEFTCLLENGRRLDLPKRRIKRAADRKLAT